MEYLIRSDLQLTVGVYTTEPMSRSRVAFRPHSSAFYGVLTGSGGNLDKQSATSYGKKSYVADFCKYHPPIIFILVLK